MLYVIGQDISCFFYMFIEKSVKLAGLAFFFTLIGGKLLVRKKKIENKRILIYVKSLEVFLLVIYLYMVIGITIISRQGQYFTTINLVLFSSFNSALIDPKFIFENILLFFPFAILLYILAPQFRKLYISMLTGFLCSFSIEIIQLITHLGCFFLDDIFFNSIGMLMGYLICFLITYFKKIILYKKYTK